MSSSNPVANLYYEIDDKVRTFIDEFKVRKERRIVEEMLTKRDTWVNVTDKDDPLTYQKEIKGRVFRIDFNCQHLTLCEKDPEYDYVWTQLEYIHLKDMVEIVDGVVNINWFLLGKHLPSENL